MKILTIQVTDSVLADRIRMFIAAKEKKYKEMSTGIPTIKR